MADRTRNFVWGLATGYALTGANIIYTLVSVPLALHFLNREQFGLWVLVAQLASYLNMLDLGMQSSASRIFVNHKDHKQGGSYGSLVRTSFYVFGAQALGVLGLGFGFLPVLDRWMGFAPATSDSFQALMGWQILILAFGFSGRTFGCILHAHQKYTWANWGGAGGLILGLGALAAALSVGWGVFSLTAAGAVTAIFNTLLQLYGCVRLRLLPARGAWGTWQWPMAKNLFSFAKDTFLIALGWQLISASPAILISKLVGLEAAATWAVGTKLFMLFQQIVWKLYDFSTSGLAGGDDQDGDEGEGNGTIPEQTGDHQNQEEIKAVKKLLMVGVLHLPHPAELFRKKRNRRILKKSRHPLKFGRILEIGQLPYWPKLRDKLALNFSSSRAIGKMPFP